MDSHSLPGLPPSGPWSGYYFYRHDGARHRMRIGLTFTSGGIDGEGIDDIGPFTIRGFFDSTLNRAEWTKSYIGMHSVEYHGFYDGRSICGDWMLPMGTGGFWIWPDGLEHEDAIQEELQQPLEVALTKK